LTPDRLLGSPTPAPLPGGRGEGDCFALRAKATVPHSGRTTGGGGQRGGPVARGPGQESEEVVELQGQGAGLCEAVAGQQHLPHRPHVAPRAAPDHV